jgi:enolase
MRIDRINGRQVFDSRGNPTLEVDVFLESGIMGRAIVPSGASTGVHEALELRDNDALRFLGKSVFRAAGHVSDLLNKELKGWDVSDQRALDHRMIELDGTPNKGKIGANAILGVSLAAAKVAAAARQVPLYQYLHDAKEYVIPMPMIQIIGGGLHAGNIIDIQDFLVIPVKANSFTEAMEMTFNVYFATKKIFQQRGMSVAVSDEGGFWPAFPSNETAMGVLTDAIAAAGYIPGTDVCIALDVASSHFYNNGTYKLSKDEREMRSEEFIAMQEDWVKKYPIISIEDGCAEDDWEGWVSMTNRLGDQIQLIGDDLFTTRVDRIAKGQELGAANAVLIKMNQIGTLTETLDAVEATRKAGYRPVVSARSGETEDTTMVDLCLATGAGQIKVGSITRSERLAKYNALLRIEEELGEQGKMYKGLTR